MTRIEVGAYEAKTKLPELLRGVKAGNHYLITHRGRAIADLVPPEAAKRQGAAEAVEQLKRFMAEKPIRRVDIKELVEEGRR